MTTSIIVHRQLEIISALTLLSNLFNLKKLQLALVRNSFKVYARLIKTLFNVKEIILCTFSRKLPSGVVFSEKFEWDVLIRKNLRWKGIGSEFRKFDESVFNTDLTIPLTIPDMNFCMEHRSDFKSARIAFPSKEAFDICNDKLKFHHFMSQSGFEQYTPVIEKEQAMKFPFVLKKNIDEGGIETYIVRDEADLINTGIAEKGEDYFREELLLNEREYATHVLMKDGRIQAWLNICYFFPSESYVKGKDKYVCKYLSPCPHTEVMEKVLNKMNFEGLCCLNYKEKEGKIKIFEINPRFGGSLTEYVSYFLRKV